ncbi:hypothetical protein GCM10009856_06830 [Mycolicibacterium llatzerense]
MLGESSCRCLGTARGWYVDSCSVLPAMLADGTGGNGNTPPPGSTGATTPVSDNSTPLSANDRKRISPNVPSTVPHVTDGRVSGAW